MHNVLYCNIDLHPLDREGKGIVILPACLSVHITAIVALHITHSPKNTQDVTQVEPDT